MDGAGNGFLYRGSLTYRKDGTGIALESAEYDQGRIVADASGYNGYRVLVHIPDHLGNVRVVADDECNVLERNGYYPFGSRWKVGSLETTNRYRFNGKEEQAKFGLPYIDYGARQYDPSLARWSAPDPLAEKYYGISPYAFCANNPVNYVDPDGRNPIYNRFGTLLGTDDGGLHGKALFMDDADFVQGMNQNDALLHDKGIGFLENEEAIDSFQANYTSLSKRPDWDGDITLEEANEWYRSGNGQPLFADINKIDLPVWMISKDSPVGQKQVVNTLFGSLRSWLVYGKITLKHYPDNGVRAYSDNYGFEMKKTWLTHMGRNIETIIGSMVAGQGAPYNIHIYGIRYL